jgi:hypothetical protein
MEGEIVNSKIKERVEVGKRTKVVLNSDQGF